MRIIDAYELVIASFIVIKVMRVKKAPDGLTIGDMYPESWTHFLIMRGMWMPSCILQVASILFFSEFFRCCSSKYILRLHS